MTDSLCVTYYITHSINSSLCKLLLKLWVLSDTHTRLSETENRCRGTTPGHAEYTPPRGLATKTTSGFITVSQLDEKEERTQREPVREADIQVDK